MTYFATYEKNTKPKETTGLNKSIYKKIYLYLLCLKASRIFRKICVSHKNSHIKLGPSRLLSRLETQHRLFTCLENTK